MLRNRLKYALTYREVVAIVMQRLIAIDGKVRTDKCYPAGFMGGFFLTYQLKFRLHLVDVQSVVSFQFLSGGCSQAIYVALWAIRSIMWTLVCVMQSILCSVYPYADVISIAKTNENFRLLYDSKGRFTLHLIDSEEAKVLAALLISNVHPRFYLHFL
jgi:ribosomal protein S4E